MPQPTRGQKADAARYTGQQLATAQRGLARQRRERKKPGQQLTPAEMKQRREAAIRSASKRRKGSKGKYPQTGRTKNNERVRGSRRQAGRNADGSVDTNSKEFKQVALTGIKNAMESGQPLAIAGDSYESALSGASRQGFKVKRSKDGSASITLRDGRKFKVKAV